MKKLLFICSKNELRSPTAENIFKTYKDVEARSAGIDIDANVRVNAEDIEWADFIFVMEKHHEYKLKNKFNENLKSKKIFVLNIEDNYPFMDIELIKILKKKVSRFLEL